MSCSTTSPIGTRSAGVVAAELDLAWWSTVFEEILRQDPAMAAYDGAALSRLVAEFRALDRRHLTDRALLHVAASRESLRQRLHRCDEQTQALFGEIVEDRFTSLRAAVERYPDVTRHLRPCLVVGPMLVPHVLPPTRTEDLRHPGRRRPPADRAGRRGDRPRQAGPRGRRHPQRDRVGAAGRWPRCCPRHARQRAPCPATRA